MTTDRITSERIADAINTLPGLSSPGGYTGSMVGRDAAIEAVTAALARPPEPPAVTEALRREQKVLEAMATWPTGANGPIAIAAYEALVRRLLLALAATSESDAAGDQEEQP